jgi:hypothetical protein
LALERDDPAEAQRLFGEALTLMPPQPMQVAALQCYLAEARARQGRVIGARAAAAAAADVATETDSYTVAFAAMADGWAAAAEGSADAVRTAFEKATSLFEQQSMATDLADCRIAYARALTRIGDGAAATVQLNLAREAFEAMHATGSVAYVDELFAKMSEGADLFGPLA